MFFFPQISTILVHYIYFLGLFLGDFAFSAVGLLIPQLAVTRVLVGWPQVDHPFGGRSRMHMSRVMQLLFRLAVFCSSHAIFFRISRVGRNISEMFDAMLPIVSPSVFLALPRNPRTKR